MSTPPTGIKLPGSIASSAQATIPLGPDPYYVEFYLAAVWNWTDPGRKRLIDFMESLNVDRPTYNFDAELQAVKVRCPKDSEVYVRRKFLHFMEKIEDEYQQSWEEADPVQEDGTLADLGHHTDVRLPEFLPDTRQLPEDPLVKSDTSSNIRGVASQSDTHTISLVVPDELRDTQHIVVWQDLQAKNRNFEGTYFFSPAAKTAIESYHDVRIIKDNAQKVIFIGSTSSLDAAKEAKTRLTRLLQHHQSSRKLPSISHHCFYVEVPTLWTVDTREITQINPVLAPSTIFDPWEYHVPEQYDLFHDDAGVFALRVCLESPFRNGQRNKTWSLFGPRAQNVFNGRPAKRSSRFFEGLKAARRLRASGDEPADSEAVGNWLQDLKVSAVIEEATNAIPELVSGMPTVTHDVGEDDPIPLSFDPSRRPDATLQAPERRQSRSGNGDTDPQPTSILDQQDAILRDSFSTLQRAMRPSQRFITVPYSDLAKHEPPCPSTPPFQPSIDQPSRESSGIEAQTRNQEELGIFTASVGRLMDRMRGRYGAINLCAEIGRYYACAVPESGQAVNQQNDPAWGWEPNDLRIKMETHQSFLFTKALTSWGNDADFLGATPWEPSSRAIFFDFRFQATLSKITLDMVLEVNAEDYTWKIRFLDNVNDAVYVHCLAQQWDFRVALTHDRPLEYQGNWAKFAEALIKSLDVKPPEVEFQHTFTEVSITDNDCPISIQDVRARQVCRFQHQDRKTFLDIKRVLPTKVISSRDPKYRKVRGVLTKSSINNPGAGDNPLTGDFAQWFEASLSSVRLEELLQQNQLLIPGDEADWSVEQIEQEKLLIDIYQQAAEFVTKMNGVGVECNNGHELRRPKADPKVDYPW
ncbi:hypothetical protein N0V93_001076 [Gnomoniopsis smithogilvyi]|uniref:Uncharacterized protein n=1 Tax=Gnomoniopsis smithogilvyi TaxID=1191159 RepID=A0A9W8Z4W5_9PEZI|nr:hypothetical protein N0V93_001076 [Gnomoniopsis smithogilvyi]